MVVQSNLELGLIHYINKVGAGMAGMLLFLVIGSIFAALGLAAARWGVDTRDWSFQIR